MNGKGEGIHCPQGHLFIKQFDMIKELAGRPRRPLRWALIEDVEPITYILPWGNLWKQMNEWWTENMLTGLI